MKLSLKSHIYRNRSRDSLSFFKSVSTFYAPSYFVKIRNKNAKIYGVDFTKNFVKV